MTSASSQLLTVYSTDHCGDCIRSMRYLDSHGVKYASINIEHDELAAAHVMSLNNGYQSVPVITFPDGTHLTEPSNRALETKLKELSIL
jgi:mycoredoxin